MDTPAAPLYSTLTFGYNENNNIINCCNSNILFYNRYIDDIIGIWTTAHDTTGRILNQT